MLDFLPAAMRLDQLRGKLVTVSHSGLGARRTLVRSSVERGMVIMVVLPLSNSTHSSP